jgi:hypothetical protein
LSKPLISCQASNYLIWNIFRRYLLGITLIQKIDICRLLQVSQNFPASDKYTYSIYKQLRLIFDKLEISVTALLWGTRVLRVPFSLLMLCGTALR